MTFPTACGLLLNQSASKSWRKVKKAICHQTRGKKMSKAVRAFF
jgi:hypothetical protein